MTLSISLAKRQFALELERVLGVAYRSRPSNEQVARDFVVFCKYSIKLNRETVRKWRNGTAFPDLEYLVRLVEWVHCDMSKVFLDTSEGDKATASSSRISQPSPKKQISVKQIDLLMQMLKELPRDEVQDRVH